MSKHWARRVLLPLAVLAVRVQLDASWASWTIARRRCKVPSRGQRLSRDYSRVARSAKVPRMHVEESGGLKGKILVLDTDVKAGEVIHREAALWSMWEGGDFRVQASPDGPSRFFLHKGSQTILDVFFALSRHDQEKVLEMYCPSEPSAALSARFGKSGERIRELLQLPWNGCEAEAWKVLHIYQCNSQATQLSDGRWTIAMYHILSRSCHSCEPNVKYKIDGDGFMTVTAMRDIAAGEELVQSYLSDVELTWPTAQRQEKTLRVWGFECDCPRCRTPETRAKVTFEREYCQA